VPWLEKYGISEAARLRSSELGSGAFAASVRTDIASPGHFADQRELLEKDNSRDPACERRRLTTHWSERVAVVTRNGGAR
jgi:hypothetical protein